MSTKVEKSPQPDILSSRGSSSRLAAKLIVASDQCVEMNGQQRTKIDFMSSQKRECTSPDPINRKSSLSQFSDSFKIQSQSKTFQNRFSKGQKKGGKIIRRSQIKFSQTQKNSYADLSPMKV